MSSKHFGHALLGHRLADSVPGQLGVDLSALAVLLLVLLIAQVTNPVTWIVLPLAWLAITAVRVLIVARRVRHS